MPALEVVDPIAEGPLLETYLATHYCGYLFDRPKIKIF